MDEAYRIFEYLPLRYRNQANQDYLQFLWDSFETNYQNEKFTFAFVAFHMLYMSVIYSIIWKIKQWKIQEFEHALIGFSKDECKKISHSEDLFIFHIINERRIFNFLKLIGFDESAIGQFRRTVAFRNEAAHSNGVIPFNSQNSIDEQINELLDCLVQIQEECSELIEDVLTDFLNEHWDLENNQYYNFIDEINEVFVADNSLSQADINIILDFDITRLSNDPNFKQISTLFSEIKIGYAFEEA